MASDRDIFECIWLDSSADSAEGNKDIQKKLRHIIEKLCMFDNVETCEKYLRNITKESIIMIVSGAFGRQIIPKIHDLPQIIAFYVFCQNKKSNEEWANKYNKVNISIILKKKTKIFDYLLASYRLY